VVGVVNGGGGVAVEIVDYHGLLNACEALERVSLSVQVLPILGLAAAAIKPVDGAFDDSVDMGRVQIAVLSPTSHGMAN
jgi:hypothetical protein